MPSATLNAAESLPITENHPSELYNLIDAICVKYRWKEMADKMEAECKTLREFATRLRDADFLDESDLGTLRALKVFDAPRRAATSRTLARSRVKTKTVYRSGIKDPLFKKSGAKEEREKKILKAHAKRALKHAKSSAESIQLTGIQKRWFTTSMDAKLVTGSPVLAHNPWAVAVPGRKDEVLLNVERAMMSETDGKLMIQGSVVPASVKKSSLVGASITVDHLSCQPRASRLVVEGLPSSSSS